MLETLVFICPFVIIALSPKMAEEKPAGSEPAPEDKPAAGPKPKEEAPKVEGKGKRVAGILAVLIVVIGLIVALAMFGGDIFKKKTPAGEEEEELEPGEGLVEVGDPEAAAALSKEDAEALAGEEVEEGERGYVYCEQLGPGDKIATMGDDDKYGVNGPVWFAYVDEEPEAWFEHDVKYIFIDAETGEKTIYEESWPPDVNGEDIFAAADDCGGMTEVYAS